MAAPRQKDPLTQQHRHARSAPSTQLHYSWSLNQLESLHLNIGVFQKWYLIYKAGPADLQWASKCLSTVPGSGQGTQLKKIGISNEISELFLHSAAIQNAALAIFSLKQQFPFCALVDVLCLVDWRHGPACSPIRSPNRRHENFVLLTSNLITCSEHICAHLLQEHYTEPRCQGPSWPSCLLLSPRTASRPAAPLQKGADLPPFFICKPILNCKP